VRPWNLEKETANEDMNSVTHPQPSPPVMGVAVHPVLGYSAVLEEAFYRCLNGSANATDMQLLLEFQRDWARSDKENTK
jgi:hypothetical protein